MSLDTDPVLEAADSALTDAARHLGVGAVRASKAVIVCEVLEDDGSRRLWTLRSETVQNWEVRGMLHEFLSDMSAFDFADYLNGDEE